MKTSLESIVTASSLLIDVSSLMAGQKDFFLLDLYGALIDSHKKVYVKKTARECLQRYCSFSESENAAFAGLFVLEHYRKKGLVIEVSSVTELPAGNICIFTEDKEYAKKELKVIKKNGFNGKVNFWRIEKGFPVEIEVEEMSEEGKKAKLLISISIDNSASMKGEKMDRLKKAVFAFNERLQSEGLTDRIEFETTLFSGFNCTIAKPFDETAIVKEKFFAGGIPFLDLSISKSLEKLEERIGELQKKGIPYYKPWLIVLSNGENFGDMSSSIEIIRKMAGEGKLSYFPFALSDREFDGSLVLLRKLKKFITIKDAMYDDLFNWIYTIAQKRVETPIDQSFGIPANSYDGWTVK